MAAEDELNLPGLDAEASNLHLVVGASDEDEVPGGHFAHEVAGPVHARAAAEGGRDELLGRQVGAMEVLAGEPRAGEEELAHGAARRLLEIGGGDVARGARDGAADRE